MTKADIFKLIEENPVILGITKESDFELAEQNDKSYLLCSALFPISTIPSTN